MTKKHGLASGAAALCVQHQAGLARAEGGRRGARKEGGGRPAPVGRARAGKSAPQTQL